MKNYSFVLTLLLLGGCSPTTDKDVVKGDLYFGSYTRRLNRPGTYIDSLSDKINKTDFADSTAVLDLINKTKGFNKHIYSDHFIDLLVDKDSIIRLQLDSSDYVRVSQFNYDQLRQNKKKVELKVRIQKIEDAFYKCTDLVDLVVVDGQTPADKELEQQK